MPDEDQDARRNLEPPTLFGRRRRPEQTAATEPVTEPVEEPVAEPVEQPVDDPEPEPESLSEPPEPAPSTPVEPPAPVEEEPTAVLPVSDPTWMFEPPADPTTEPAAEPTAEPAAPEPAPAVLPAEGGTPLFADEVDAAPVKQRRQRTRRTPKQQRTPTEPKPAKAPRGGRARLSAPPVPTLAGWVAAALTGLLIGLLLVGSTAGSLQACEAVRGTSTCGGSGAILLVGIMAALVAIGGFLLRLFDVPDPGSTSFLALGMVAVISLLFLLDILMNWWMVFVIPAISVAMYLMAYWVTTTFVEPAKD